MAMLCNGEESSKDRPVGVRNNWKGQKTGPGPDHFGDRVYLGHLIQQWPQRWRSECSGNVSSVPIEGLHDLRLPGSTRQAVGLS